MECEGDPPLSEAGDWKMSGRGVKGAVDLDGGPEDVVQPPICACAVKIIWKVMRW